MRRLIVISGAGLSTESGIPTFRTDTEAGKALWQGYDLEEVCNIHAFNGNFYNKTHAFYNKRRVELGTVEPNLAHLRIAEWYKRFNGQVINITTNVDDLLERAGVPHNEVLHVHGYLTEVIERDHAFGDRYIRDIGHNFYDEESIYWAKPNVIFFGENAPLYGEMYSILGDLTVQDMVIVVGCSNQVINFNWELLPAVRRGTKMIVVNPGLLHHEQEIYEENGVLVYRAGAVQTFSSESFINIVENHLKG